MELMCFMFDNIDKMIETARTLRRMYDHILISYNEEQLILKVECTNSWIFDTRIISYVGKHGGRKTPINTQ